MGGRTRSDEKRLRPQTCRLALLEECWRVVGPSGRVLTCAIYRVEGPGVELRAGYSVDNFHCTKRVANVRDACAVAETWLTAMASLGYRRPSDAHLGRSSEHWSRKPAILLAADEAADRQAGQDACGSSAIGDVGRDRRDW